MATFWEVCIVASCLAVGDQEIFQLHSAGYFLLSPRRVFGSLYQISNVNPQKDNFHNPIFGIDKRTIFDIFNSTMLIKLSFSKRG